MCVVKCCDSQVIISGTTHWFNHPTPRQYLFKRFYALHNFSETAKSVKQINFTLEVQVFYIDSW